MSKSPNHTRESHPPGHCSGGDALRPAEKLCMAITPTSRNPHNRYCTDGHCHDPLWVVEHGAAHRARVEVGAAR